MTTYYFSKKFYSFYTDAQIPKAAMPKDVIVITVQVYNAMQAAIKSGMIIKADDSGQPIAVAPPVAPIPPLTVPMLGQALQKNIDALAQSWGYDNANAAATYLHSVIAQFAAEAQALMTYRDQAWHNATILFNRISAGTSPMPPSVAAFFAIVLPPVPARPTVS
jgi:hypothetical protein